MNSYVEILLIIFATITFLFGILQGLIAFKEVVRTYRKPGLKPITLILIFIFILVINAGIFLYYDQIDKNPSSNMSATLTPSNTSLTPTLTPSNTSFIPTPITTNPRSPLVIPCIDNCDSSLSIILINTTIISYHTVELTFTFTNNSSNLYDINFYETYIKDTIGNRFDGYIEGKSFLTFIRPGKSSLVGIFFYLDTTKSMSYTLNIILHSFNTSTYQEKTIKF